MRSTRSRATNLGCQIGDIFLSRKILYNILMAKDFDGQRSGEEVIYVFRRHMVSMIRGFIFFFICVALGIIPMFIWPENSKMIFLLIIMIFVGLLGLGYSYILWHYSFYLLTSQRLRQNRQKGIFKKIVVDLDLDNIQSASFAVPGMGGAMFNYGTILVQTGAGDLVMSMVSHPETVYNKLEDARHAYINEEDYDLVHDYSDDEDEDEDDSVLDGEISYEKD